MAGTEYLFSTKTVTSIHSIGKFIGSPPSHSLTYFRFAPSNNSLSPIFQPKKQRITRTTSNRREKSIYRKNDKCNIQCIQVYGVKIRIERAVNSKSYRNWVKPTSNCWGSIICCILCMRQVIIKIRDAHLTKMMNLPKIPQSSRLDYDPLHMLESRLCSGSILFTKLVRNWNPTGMSRRAYLW